MGVVVNKTIIESRSSADTAAPAGAATKNAPAESATPDELAVSDISNTSTAENPWLRCQFAYYKKSLMYDK